MNKAEAKQARAQAREQARQGFDKAIGEALKVLNQAHDHLGMMYERALEVAEQKRDKDIAPFREAFDEAVKQAEQARVKDIRIAREVYLKAREQAEQARDEAFKKITQIGRDKEGG